MCELLGKRQVLISFNLQNSAQNTATALENNTNAYDKLKHTNNTS